MGSPMAANLLRAGFDLTVFNKTPESVEKLRSAGAKVAADPAELGRNCEVICTSLPNGQIVESVLLGKDGVLTHARPGTIVIDHSTVSPADARRIAARCQAIGCLFLDAPVSGGPEGARAGELAVFLGGDELAADRAKPVLAAYSKTVVYMGKTGSGQVAKLANQITIAATVLGISEAFRYTQARGIDSAKLRAVLEGATADSAMLRTRVPVAGLQPHAPASNGWRPGFTTDFMAKDLDFALADAAEIDLELTSTNLVRRILSLVQSDGRGGDDWTILSQYLPTDPDGGSVGPSQNEQL